VCGYRQSEEQLAEAAVEKEVADTERKQEKELAALDPDDKQSAAEEDVAEQNVLAAERTQARQEKEVSISIFPRTLIIKFAGRFLSTELRIP